MPWPPTTEDVSHLRDTLAWVYERSPHYRRVLDGAGVRPGEIGSYGDFRRRVPRTDKSDLVEQQRARPPFDRDVVEVWRRVRPDAYRLFGNVAATYAEVARGAGSIPSAPSPCAWSTRRPAVAIRAVILVIWRAGSTSVAGSASALPAHPNWCRAGRCRASPTRRRG